MCSSCLHRCCASLQSCEARCWKTLYANVQPIGMTGTAGHSALEEARPGDQGAETKIEGVRETGDEPETSDVHEVETEGTLVMWYGNT